MKNFPQRTDDESSDDEIDSNAEDTKSMTPKAKKATMMTVVGQRLL